MQENRFLIHLKWNSALNILQNSKGKGRETKGKGRNTKAKPFTNDSRSTEATYLERKEKNIRVFIMLTELEKVQLYN